MDLSEKFSMTVVTGDCDEHGPWEAKALQAFADRTGCPTCAEIAEADRQQRIDRENAERNEQALRARLVASGVTIRHAGDRFENYVPKNESQQRAMSASRRLADAVFDGKTRIGSLILCGTTGTGKTHLSCAVVNHLLRSARPVDAVRINILDLFRRVKETYARGSVETERRVIEWAAKLDLLIIDEVGVQFGTDAEKQITFEIINRRYEACLPTMLVSNLDLTHLTQELGERVIDRLRQDGGRLVVVDGDSHRRQLSGGQPC